MKNIAVALMSFVVSGLALFLRGVDIALRTASAIIMWMFIFFTVFFYYELVINKTFNGYEVMLSSRELPPFRTSEVVTTGKEKYDSAIKMYQESGSFLCSATVISDTYALTAAHCLVKLSQPSDLEFGVKLNKGDLTIKSKTGLDTGIKAKVAGVKFSQDVGLIMGDFREFRKGMVDFKPAGMLAHRGPFYTCGFPGGDDWVCTPFSPKGPSGFQIGGIGYLYKGMSGGPVIDITTGEIVAVNSRIVPGGAAVSPLVGLLPSLGIEVQ